MTFRHKDTSVLLVLFYIYTQMKTKQFTIVLAYLKHKRCNPAPTDFNESRI